MCRYLTKNELKEPKRIFMDWIRKVQIELKENNHIHFSFEPIGSGKRNMVVMQCNRNSFDLDYQITLTKMPDELLYNLDKKAKEIKYLFKNAFDKYRPEGFKNFDDSTQALTTLNEGKRFGYDVIITYRYNNTLHILYNKKNTNNANNKDYWWAPKSDMSNYRTDYFRVINSKKREALKKLYLKKRHSYKDDVEPNKKKSYQILNEAVKEILKGFIIE